MRRGRHTLELGAHGAHHAAQEAAGAHRSLCGAAPAGSLAARAGRNSLRCSRTGFHCEARGPPASVTNWNLYPILPSSCWNVAICSLLRFFSQLKEGEQL